MKKVIKITLSVGLTILLLSALITDAENMTNAVITSVENCLYLIIPALFGFMLISSFLIKSGLYVIIFKPFYFVLRFIIRLGEEEFGIFLLSLFGGYPVGAKLISENVPDIATPVSINANGVAMTAVKPLSAAIGGERRHGTCFHVDKTCNKFNKNLSAFCYCPSPGFVASVVGVGIFSNPKAGLIVYISNVFACVLIAILLTGFFPTETDRKRKFERKKIPVKLTGGVFISSIMSASSALFPVCAVMVAFGVLGGALRFIGIENALLFAFLELSNAAKLTPALSSLPLIAALFSTGGLCILTQIPAIIKNAKEKIPLKRFFLLRIPAALLSALICRLIMSFVNISDSVAYAAAASSAVSASGINPTQAGSPVASAALLIMAMLLVKTANEKLLKNGS